MIILAAVAALTTLHGEAAYIAGRCAMWQTPRQQTITVLKLSEFPPQMMRMYGIGVAESEKEPLTAEVCKRAIADINADIAKANKK